MVVKIQIRKTYFSYLVLAYTHTHVGFLSARLFISWVKVQIRITFMLFSSIWVKVQIWIAFMLFSSIYSPTSIFFSLHNDN